jgi:hypothetical protein
LVTHAVNLISCLGFMGRKGSDRFCSHAGSLHGLQTT